MNLDAILKGRNLIDRAIPAKPVPAYFAGVTNLETFCEVINLGAFNLHNSSAIRNPLSSARDQEASPGRGTGKVAYPKPFHPLKESGISFRVIASISPRARKGNPPFRIHI